MDDIEDTNTPWDWDHIYPSSWVDHKQCYQIFKKWNSCTGNFRAISLAENRSESDHISPHERLENEDSRKTSFVLEKTGKR
ncbi:MAG: hypothetical protein ACRC0A_03305 [Chitinophagaceae bacterium]